MEFDNPHIARHPYAFGHDIRDVEYSASIERHTYWARFRDNAVRSRQASPMVKGSPRDETQPQHPKPRTPSPARGQKRRRSQEQSDPSPRLRRSQRLGGQGAFEDAQSHAVTSNSPQNFAIDTVRTTSGGPSTVAESLLPEIPLNGTITISLNRRPPQEIRTGVLIPLLSVTVTIRGSDYPETGDYDPEMDFGTLHAVVTLWSADGRVASPHAVPPMLAGHRDATLVRVDSANSSERQVEATFSDLAITQPGHYRLRIAIMETPLPERGDDNDNSVESPRQLLSIETRPIHAHGFASAVKR